MAAARPLGFIGLGIMGGNMARRLLDAGETLVVWNRTASKGDALAAEYGTERVVVAAAPSEVVELVGVDGMTFSMLSTPSVSRAVFRRADGTGTCDGLERVGGARTTLIDCATLEERDMVDFAAHVTAAGARFLEAPVSGSKVPAATGQLVFLAAGDRAAFEDAAPRLAAMGKASLFLGEAVGRGTRMKLAVNMTMGTMMASLAEGIALAHRLELDPRAFVDVLGMGAMASPLVAAKGANICAVDGAQRDHAPHFPLKHAQKDVAFALRAFASAPAAPAAAAAPSTDGARSPAAALPLATATDALMRAAMELDGGALADADFSALSEALLRRPR